MAAKYSSLGAGGNSEVSLYIDDWERKDILGKPKYGILDWIILAFLYAIWLVSLPATWWCSVKILAQYERVVSFRLGRMLPLKGPGLIFVIPCVDRWIKVDMRMRAFNVPPHEIHTADSGLLKVGADVQYRIADPKAVHSFIQNVDQSLRLTAQSTLNSTLGAKKITEVENEKRYLNVVLQNAINRTVVSWGVEIGRFELTKLTILKDPSGRTPSASNNSDEFQDPMQNIMNLMKEFMTPTQSKASSPPSSLLSPAELFQMLEGFLTEELVEQINSVIQFNISGKGGGSWCLNLKVGKGSVTTGTSSVAPDVTLDMSVSDFQSVIYGQLSPANAFYSGKIRADGDVAAVLKLDALVKKVQNV